MFLYMKAAQLISVFAGPRRFIERSRPKIDHLFDFSQQSHMSGEAPQQAAVVSHRS